MFYTYHVEHYLRVNIIHKSQATGNAEFINMAKCFCFFVLYLMYGGHKMWQNFSRVSCFDPTTVPIPIEAKLTFLEGTDRGEEGLHWKKYFYIRFPAPPSLILLLFK